MKAMGAQIFLGVVSIRDTDPKTSVLMVRYRALIRAGEIIRALSSANAIVRVVLFSIGEESWKESRPEGGNPPHDMTQSHDLVRHIYSLKYPVHLEAHIVRDIDGAVSYAKAQSADGLILWDTVDELTKTALVDSIARILAYESAFASVSVGQPQSAFA